MLMKRTILTLCLSALLGSLCVAGTESFSGKEKQVVPPPPPCEWYRAGEWELGLWAAYAFTDDNDGGNHDFHFHNKQYADADRQFDSTEQPVFLGDSNHTFLNDHAWGGGVDLKYFWSRHFGVGLEGFALDGDNTMGAVLGTFTVRFPIGCSRFAPYVFGGVGGLFGAENQHTDFFFAETHPTPGSDVGETEFIQARNHDSDDARVIGQVGGGLEVRLTRPSETSRLAVGVMGDFTWNFTGGDNNQNFGMARLGLTLSY
jgi:hypothetical protein